MTGLQVKTRKEKNNHDPILNCIIAVLLMGSIAKMVCGAFPTIENLWWVYGCIGSVLCIACLLLYRTKKFSHSQPISLLIAVAALTVGFFVQKEGFLVFANEILSFATGKTGTIHLDYSLAHTEYAYVAAGLVFLMLAVWIAQSIFLRRGIMLAPVCLLLAAGLLWGLFTVDISTLLFLCAMILFMAPANETEDKLAVNLYHVLSRGTVLLLILCLAGCISVVLQNQKISMENTASTIKDKVHQAKYEDGEVSMPEGSLANLSYWDKNSTPSLEIQMEKPQKLYLRGMVGEVYTGLSWEPLEEQAYLDGEDTFYWLHQEGFYSQTAISDAVTLTQQTEAAGLTIKNLGACSKYNYLPYALASKDILNQSSIGDAGNGTGQETLNVTYIPGSLPQWYQAELMLVDQQTDQKYRAYLRNEETYRDFVYANYLQMTNAAVGVCKRIFEDVKEEMTLAEITKLTRERIHLLMEYNEGKATRNGKNDFLQYTLEQQREGYSVHYATAAVLLLRYCGMPARYVEGYYLSPEEAEEYQSGDTIVLTEEHAHAWAEYYLQGVGWVPFEVTPGYIDEEEILTAQKIAAGTDGIAGGGSTIKRNELNYKPPLKPPADNDKEDEKPSFRMSLTDVLMILAVILFILIAVFIARVCMRYRKLTRALKEVETADHKTAIAMEYAYAKMLQKRAGMERMAEDETETRARLLNQEALFSNHQMSAEARETVKQYRENTLTACKAKWNRRERAWNHYILWLYK